MNNEIQKCYQSCEEKLNAKGPEKEFLKINPKKLNLFSVDSFHIIFLEYLLTVSSHSIILVSQCLLVFEKKNENER